MIIASVIEQSQNKLFREIQWDAVFKISLQVSFSLILIKQ